MFVRHFLVSLGFFVVKLFYQIPGGAVLLFALQIRMGPSIVDKIDERNYKRLISQIRSALSGISRTLDKRIKK